VKVYAIDNAADNSWTVRINTLVSQNGQSTWIGTSLEAPPGIVNYQSSGDADYVKAVVIASCSAKNVPYEASPRRGDPLTTLLTRGRTMPDTADDAAAQCEAFLASSLSMVLHEDLPAMRYAAEDGIRCALCGLEIPKARRKALPGVGLCLPCALEEEEE